MPRGKRRSSQEEVEDLGGMGHPAIDDQDDDAVEVQFTQTAPEPSQPLFSVKPAEKNNLNRMGEDNKHKAVTDLSRLILFKALAGESIDRLKCAKEALADFSNERITSAAFDEAGCRLREVFGFELKRVPKFMEERKNFPAKYKDRLFLVNEVADDQSGDHSKAIHSIHAHSVVERGLLMIVLAFAFCKGEPRGDGSRWISDKDLYRLLNSLDENIPSEPPIAGTFKKSSTQLQSSGRRFKGGDGVSQTPDVDGLIHKFVEMDFLLKEKDREDGNAAVSQTQGDDGGFLYSMGPRAVLEIGRKQVVYFCAEILDEEPDPTMMAEIDDVTQDEEVEEEPIAT